MFTFTDASGEILYTSHYKIIDNMIEEAIPFKYLVTKEQRWAPAKQIVSIVGLIFLVLILLAVVMVFVLISTLG